MIRSPDRAAGTARDNGRILLDSLMPIALVIHPGPGRDRVVDRVSQMTEMDVPLPRHKLEYTSQAGPYGLVRLGRI